MPRISNQDKTRFVGYVKEAKHVVENLAFFLDCLGESVALDYSVQSLAIVEGVFWRCVEEGMLEEESDVAHFSQLLGQYLGESVIYHTGAKWIQSDEKNPMCTQPCIDGFGGQVWDRIYPVHTALNIRSLPSEKPNFPGVHQKKVFAAKLEKALAVYEKSRVD